MTNFIRFTRTAQFECHVRLCLGFVSWIHCAATAKLSNRNYAAWYIMHIVYIFLWFSYSFCMCISVCLYVCAFTINATVSLLVLKHKWLGALEVLGPLCLQYIIYATFHVVWLWLISTFLFLIHFDCVPFRLQCSKVLLVDKCI